MSDEADFNRIAARNMRPYWLDVGGVLRQAGATYPMPSGLYGPNGEPLATSTFAGKEYLGVHAEDIDVEPINQLAHNVTVTNTPLAGDIAIEATVLTLTSAVGFATGDRILIDDGTNSEHHLPQITDLTGVTATLDGPIDHAYLAANTTITKVLVNLEGLVGTIGAPISYVVKPHASEVWHLTRLNFSIQHAVAADDGKFGGIAALGNGVVLRTNTALLGLRTLTNWKANKDMIEDMYDVKYSDKVGSSNNGTNGRWSFKQRAQFVIRLDGSQGDEFEILIQDNLTTLVDFQINLQGHVDEGS